MFFATPLALILFQCDSHKDFHHYQLHVNFYTVSDFSLMFRLICSLLMNAVTKPDHIVLNDWIKVTNCKEEHFELSAPTSSGEILYVSVIELVINRKKCI
jgi:hypothetical protein